MLRASNRVLRPGGKIGFFVIGMADELSDEDAAVAIDAGPPFVGVATPYPEMAYEAGFEDVVITDVTAAYLRTLRAWHREWMASSSELRAIVGKDEYAERLSNRSKAIAAIERRVLRRILIAGVRPG